MLFLFLKPTTTVLRLRSSTADKHLLNDPLCSHTDSSFPSLEMFYSGETSTQPAAWFRPQGSGRELLHSGADHCGLGLSTGIKQGKGSFDDRRSVPAARAGQNTPPLPCGHPEAPGFWRQHPTGCGSSMGSPCPHAALPCAMQRGRSTALMRILQEAQA